MTDLLSDLPSTLAPPKEEAVRHPRWRRRLLLGVGLVFAAGASWLVVQSPLMEIKAITVVGSRVVNGSQIQSMLGVPEGQPLATYDVGSARDRIASIPRVATVDVRRGWPSTLVVVITERQPVAAVKVPAGFAIIDATGTPFQIDPKAGKLPVLQPMSRPAQVAALAAVAGMPADLRARVAQVSATNADTIMMTLRGGGLVRWGGPEASDTKGRVLRTLLQQKAEVYDVMAPMQPTTQGGLPDDKESRVWP